MAFGRDSKHPQDVPNSDPKKLTGSEDRETARSTADILSQSQSTAAQDPTQPQQGHAADARYNAGGQDPNAPQGALIKGPMTQGGQQGQQGQQGRYGQGQGQGGQGGEDPSGLEHLTERVKGSTDASASAQILLNGIADQLSEAQSDPGKVQAVVQHLRKNASHLGAAILHNTPAGNPAKLPPNQL